MTLDKVVIIGAGNGGQAAAVDLTNKGYKVCLYEFPEFSSTIDDKKDSKKIKASGFVNGTVEIDEITTDAQKAANYSDTSLVMMPAFGHKKFFDTFENLLHGRVYLFPGNMSSLSAQCRPEVTLVEFSSLPYGCRLQDDGSVNISIRTKEMTYAAFPAEKTDQITKEAQTLYDNITPVSDIFEVSLNNPNPLIHPPGVLLNIGRIEHSQGQFYMYNEGMTDSILRMIKAVNQERHDISEVMGYNLVDFSEFGGIMPDGTEKSFIDCGKDALMLGPCNRDNRYLTEDVPYGLVYWSEIAKKLGVSTPNIDAVVAMTSTVCNLSFDEQRNYVGKFPNGAQKIKEFLG